MERPRASLLSWDTRYLVARPVACVSEMNGLGIAKKYKRYSFSELKVWTGKPINRPSIFLFPLSLLRLFHGFHNMIFTKKKNVVTDMGRLLGTSISV